MNTIAQLGRLAARQMYKQAIQEAIPDASQAQSIRGVPVTHGTGGRGKMLSRGMDRKLDKGKGVSMQRVNKRRNRQGQLPLPQSLDTSMLGDSTNVDRAWDAGEFSAQEGIRPSGYRNPYGERGRVGPSP